MKRRQVLALGGTGVLSAIAGCGSGGTDTSGSSSNPTATDEPPTTEPAARTTIETATDEPPSFELVEYSIPETVEIGEPVSFEITLRNTGLSNGDFSAPLYFRTPESEWQEGGEWVFTDVFPGTIVTATSDEKTTFDYIQQYEYRLGEFTETTVLQTVSATVPWGEEYVTPGGYRIQVDEPTLQDAYSCENSAGETEQRTPDGDAQWAFVNVRVVNETGYTADSPIGSDFALLDGNSQVAGRNSTDYEPVEKGDPFDSGELQHGDERSGWILYSISSSAEVEDVEIAWAEDTYQGQISARWGM